MRTGLLASLLMLPALLGVMACFELPAPLGNPEKSRVDPAMTGAWAAGFEDGKKVGAWILVLEPYDKRTWLVSWLVLEEPKGYEQGVTESPKQEFDVIARWQKGALELDAMPVFKGWLSKIKGIASWFGNRKFCSSRTGP